MNCQKDDIARIVGLPQALRGLNDSFVCCVGLFVCMGHPCWMFDRPIKFAAERNICINGITYWAGEKGELTGLADKYLRPIRGQDGADETLAWKPVPLPEIPELAPAPQRELSL